MQIPIIDGDAGKLQKFSSVLKNGLSPSKKCSADGAKVHVQNFEDPICDHTAFWCPPLEELSR